MPLIQPVRLEADTGPPDPARPAAHCRRRKMRLAPLACQPTAEPARVCRSAGGGDP